MRFDIKRIALGLGIILGLLIIFNTAFSDRRQTRTIGSVADRQAPKFSALPPEIAPEAGLEKRAETIAPTDDLQQRVIKIGELSLRVKDVSKQADEIRDAVKSRGGYVESSSISDPGEGPRTGWMTLRIPVNVLDETIKQIKALAILTLEESTQGQDVTLEFVDLEADLRNARAEEQSYLDILKRSGTIEEVLSVTQRLAEVRGRIERLEGRKRYLENRTDLATLNVRLTEETRVEVPGRTWRPFEVLRDALRDLVASLQALIDFLIRLIVGVIGLLIPIAALVAFIIWVGWKIVRIFLKRLRK